MWTSWDAATDRQDAADRRSGQSAGDFPRCGRRYDAPESVRGGLEYRLRALGRDDVDRLAACSRAVFLWGIPTDLGEICVRGGREAWETLTVSRVCPMVCVSARLSPLLCVFHLLRFV